MKRLLGNYYMHIFKIKEYGKINTDNVAHTKTGSCEIYESLSLAELDA